MTVEDLERVKRSVIRRYPISAGLALQGVTIELSKKVDTAAVVGKKNDQGIIEVEKLLVNPDFMDRLTFSQRVFVLAHEALHIALKHFARSVDKPEADAQREYEKYCEREPDEKKREMKKAYLQSHYHRLWNIATDACINAFLKRDGFAFPENVINPKTGKPMQFVDMKDGLIRSAEKIYDALVRREEEKKKQEQLDVQKQDSSGQPTSGNDQENASSNQEKQNNSDNQEQQNGQSNEDYSFTDELPDPHDYDGFDSHDHWSEDAKTEEKTDADKGKETQTKSVPKQEQIDDKELLERELQSRRGEKEEKEEKKNPFSALRSKLGIPDVKVVKSVLSWKRVLADTQERIIETWGKRRASRFNPNPRIEERTEEEAVGVEVILDVSGSISVELLRGFLMQLYPIFETLFGKGNVSLKVGTFSSSFSGFQDINSREDIKAFDPNIGGWTNYELAATSFSSGKGKKVIKIVFTDGVLDGSKEHVQRTRVPDIIWIVFGDRMNFTPVGGRIIRVGEKEYKEMIANGLIDQSDYHKRI